MPISFRDSDEIEELGVAGYLKIDSPGEGKSFRGALFLVNARGEPVEFSYNKIETPASFLWRQDDIQKHATRKLVTSLLDTCQKTPRFLICMAEEIGHELFCNEIHVEILVCRIGHHCRVLHTLVRKSKQLWKTLSRLIFSGFLNNQGMSH